ncbi:copper chaperone PCu(A)C [Sphingomonas sp. SUN039]|uniref:copper chaperone PCu(A)C n=1 Tax=Sphingomonas sp. SUN039 TaxID=2937787 RepID=UPI0021641815|nr:copper chaperone PCu(A)C [Sphingomonas sp. SUN039]UVO54032.1 copper chaperone PCu(A)C [Sphingomonas sp. SUN039]
MRALGLIGAVSAIALAGCAAKPTEPTVADAIVRMAANPKAPSAGYFTLKGGPKDDTLLTVTSPVVIRVEMHESMTGGNMASMKPLDGGVVVPANSDVKFEPGGKHIMLYNINPGMKVGQTMRLDFVFASGLQLSAYAPLRAAGSAE